MPLRISSSLSWNGNGTKAAAELGNSGPEGSAPKGSAATQYRVSISTCGQPTCRAYLGCCLRLPHSFPRGRAA